MMLDDTRNEAKRKIYDVKGGSKPGEMKD